ncbi:hypothetical protein JXQ31_08045 [candidate division KSB1 bacterium]|nr:hypothetical protein [candidate division KSB1 bacterium]
MIKFQWQKVSTHWFLIFFVFSTCFDLYSQTEKDPAESKTDNKKKIDFTIRLGQGGFTDNRSPIGKLGGGQLTLDIKPKKLPVAVAVSVSNEYYTNSAEPTHSYEIAGLTAVNILYMTKLLKNKRVTFFAGGGAGGLNVPKSEENPDEMEKGIFYNIEAGLNIRLFWKMGFYGIYKYLYAKKEINHVNVINFSEHIVLLGFTFQFSL